MKLLIASDIHGDLDSAKDVFSAYVREGAEKLLLLGDILYHGPRNDLPKTYDPKAVIELLNSNKDKILSVRGNCDTEVDQMVLDFPILADYAVLYVNGLTVFATHGHHHTKENPPPLSKGDILIHGHTHVLKIEEFGDNNTFVNPGSAALPKEGNPRSYALLENKKIEIKDFFGNTILTKEF